jgi:hypothetical protein
MATFTKSEIYKGWRYQPSRHMLWLTSEFLPRVDASVSIAATESLVPHLSTRHWVERLDYLSIPTQEVAGCAIYDASLSNWPMQDVQTKEVLPQTLWKEVYQCGQLQVWAREGVKCLTSMPDCPS